MDADEALVGENVVLEAQLRINMDSCHIQDATLLAARAHCTSIKKMEDKPCDPHGQTKFDMSRRFNHVHCSLPLSF